MKKPPQRQLKLVQLVKLINLLVQGTWTRELKFKTVYNFIQKEK